MERAMPPRLPRRVCGHDWIPSFLMLVSTGQSSFIPLRFTLSRMSMRSDLTQPMLFIERCIFTEKSINNSRAQSLFIRYGHASMHIHVHSGRYYAKLCQIIAYINPNVSQKCQSNNPDIINETFNVCSYITYIFPVAILNFVESKYACCHCGSTSSP